MDNPISSQEFRTAMGLFATGVTVVTTMGNDRDHVHGMTANAFASVSLDPPLILVSVDRRAECHALVLENRGFAVNILREDQESVSRQFAGKADRSLFDSSQFEWAGDIPVIARCLCSIACTLWADYDGGDHTLFVGRVQSLQIHDANNPLLYFRSGYHKLGQAD
ncbi:MAG: flavin reductase family protein [Bacilli bacterium]